MRIAVTGASGLLGSALCAYLNAAGHEVLRLVRRNPAGSGEVFWNPDTGVLADEALRGLDAVVNLAGENISTGRWTSEKKRTILDSRVNATRLISKALAQQNRDAVLISASALGYYGDRGDEILDESSPAGTDFLASVCQAWEAATEAAAEAGVRVVRYRIGIVLSREGGALRQMLPIFRAGLGGRLGSGKQWMSWIVVDDLLRGIEHCIKRKEINGPVNACSPYPVINKEFTQVLARVLRRPALLPVPAMAMQIALGEMADSLLLSSTRMLPKKLESSEFKWKYPVLQDALAYLLLSPR
ncbi:MAG: TIGR01777 family oxidoreductase [Rectinema sp.]|nr:TIGR01777 family oxidoreductase [Rectinema sp.]